MWLDVLAVAILALFAFLGARRGGLAAGLGLLSLGVAYGAAVFAAPRFGDATADLFGVSPLLGMPLAGSIAFLVAYVLLGILSKLLRMLEADELREIADAGEGQEVECQFCGRAYQLGSEELRALL